MTQTRFYSQEELKKLNFKHLGYNVQVARTAIIPEPERISLGDHTKIDDFCILTGDIEIGNYCHIAHKVHLSGHFGIILDDFCTIGSNSVIYTESDDHKANALIGPVIPNEMRSCYRGQVMLRNFVAIAANCIIMPGAYFSPGAMLRLRSNAWGRFFSWAEFESKTPSGNAEFVRERDEATMPALAKKLSQQEGGVFITAELSTNWEGDINNLVKLMVACKQAGCNAVKLQAFKKEHLSSGRFERLASSVTAENIAEIDKAAKYVGIEWYCTPCYPEAVDFLDPYVNRYKIRFKDCHNTALWERIMKTGKKVIMACDEPMRFDTGKIKTLYCISKYPTPKEDIDYDLMKKYDGFSCHTPDVSTVIKSVLNGGINYLEMHITPDKDKDLIDNKVSFDIKYLKALIDQIRKIEDDRRNNSTSKTNEQTISQ